MSNKFDVAIIGYGPTGATLANLLGQYGIRVVVIEREADIYDLPRAVHFDDEIMRIFQSAGIADELLKKVRVNPGMRFVDAEGKLLLDWPRPAGIGPQGWNTSYRFHQPDLERILRSSASKMETVTTLCSHRVTSLVEHDNHVSLTVENNNGDGTETIEFQADFAVGCDGARSMLRTFMNVDMEDFGFHEKWLVVDVLLTRSRPDLGDHSIQHCDPDRSATYVRGPKNRRRWEISLGQQDQDLDFTDSMVIWSLLERWITPDDAELERHAVYEFRSVVAETWSRNRLFLAGDAAHQMPPFMGQGLCAGTRDAANLAWKLAACINDGAPPSLLDSYETERRPHVRQFVQMSMRLGGLINASKTQEALAAAFPQADGSARLKSLYPALGPGLGPDGQIDESPLSSQPVLSSGERLDDHIGLGPALLVNDLMGPIDLSGFEGVTLLASKEAAVNDYLTGENALALLLRPDRYIFGKASSIDEVSHMISAWNQAMR